MPLLLYYWPSLEKSFKGLGPQQKELAERILKALEAYYASNCDLEVARKLAPRFFYKQLRRPYYEAGIESNVRVVISREGQKCTALLVGNHDQIRRFLARV